MHPSQKHPGGVLFHLLLTFVIQDVPEDAFILLVITIRFHPEVALYFVDYFVQIIGLLLVDPR